jgi:hypothetical protein
MKKLVFSLLLAVIVASCGENNNEEYIKTVSEEKIVLVEKDYRTMDFKTAYLKILKNGGNESVIESIKKHHKTNFKWSDFWGGLSHQSELVNDSIIINLAELSTITCNQDNSKSFFIFLAEKAKKISAGKYLKAINHHLRPCGQYFTKIMSQSVSSLINLRKSELKKQETILEYSNYLQVVYSSTNILKTGDISRIIEVGQIRSVVTNSFLNSNKDVFYTLIELVNKIYPENEIKRLIKSLPQKVNIEIMNNIVDVTSSVKTNDMLDLLIQNNLLHKDVQSQDVNEILEKNEMSLKLNSVEDIITLIESFERRVDTALKLSKRSSESYPFLLSNQFIKRLISLNQLDIIKEALQKLNDSSPLITYLKSLFNPEHLVLNTKEDIDNFEPFDKINILFSRLRMESDSEVKLSIIENIEKVFAKNNLPTKHNKYLNLDDNLIGVAQYNLKKTNLSVKYEELHFSYYGIYRINNLEELKIISSKTINGGHFDLSNTIEQKELGALPYHRKLDPIVIPLIVRPPDKNALGTSDAYIFYYEYHHISDGDFDWKNYPLPAAGFKGGDIEIELSENPMVAPKITSSGGPGQKGHVRPVEVKGEVNFNFNENIISQAVIEKDATLDTDYMNNDSFFKSTVRNIALVDGDLQNIEFFPLSYQDLIANDLAFIKESEDLKCDNCIINQLLPKILNQLKYKKLNNIRNYPPGNSFTYNLKGIQKFPPTLYGDRGPKGSMVIIVK